MAVVIKAEVLDDLASRFLINMPAKDRANALAMCYQMEVAHWFYLDHLRPEDPTLPACSLKEFMATIFKHCSFLDLSFDSKDLDKLITQWKAHKYKKPGRGAIILNEDFTKCLLVQGYPASTSWGFPKGKLEKGESDMDAAVREVYEETGFDTRDLIRENCYLEAYLNENPARMYIIPGVSEDVVFAPKTIKEISAIKWFRIKDLPCSKKDPTPKQALGKSANNFFMIIPFMTLLKKWIASNHSPKKSKSKVKGSATKPSISATFNAQPSTIKQQLLTPTAGAVQQSKNAPLSISTQTTPTVFSSFSQPGMEAFQNTTAGFSNVSHPGNMGHNQTAPIFYVSNPGVIGMQRTQGMMSMQPAQTVISGLRPIMVGPHRQQLPNFYMAQDSPRVVRSNTAPIPYPSPHPLHPHTSPSSHPHQSPLSFIHSTPLMNDVQAQSQSSSGYGTALTFNELLNAAHAPTMEIPAVAVQLNSSRSWLKFSLNRERIVSCVQTAHRYVGT